MGLGPAELGQLGLSDDQQTQIKTLLDQQRDERRGSMDEARAVQQQLGTAIFGAAAADTAQLTELTTKLADLQRQGLEAEVAMQVKIAAVLTDTQRQQLLAMRAAREAAGPRGPGGPGGRGPRTR
jgi:Spy/CpxP family protein refolding chaperone